MARKIEIDGAATLDDFAAVAHLAPAVQEVQAVYREVAPALEGRTVWMVNSTEHGGGVAEMLPTVVQLMRELGVAAEWVVIESGEPAFYHLTKQIHNLIHGAGVPELDGDDRELYEAVNRRNAEEMKGWVAPGDMLVVHDPQPLPLAPILREELDLHAVWRCHIGLDEENAATRAAWEFIEPYGEGYDHAVFSAPEYIPDFLSQQATVIHPAINPLTAKNRELPLHKLVGILANGALAVPPGPVLTPAYPSPALRLQPERGGFAPANASEDIGLLTRPIVTQVSRWDRLKGYLPLMLAFARLKDRVHRDGAGLDPFHRRRLRLVRLVLAGPDPSSVEDDPEGQEVLAELRAHYLDLPPEVQDDIALVALPMDSRVRNALMVNALQRATSVAVQNSLREGFGLTITEAMWKRVPVLTNAKACGPRQQIRDGIDGCLAGDPEDVEELTRLLDRMLESPGSRGAWGRAAQRRAHDMFLIFSQLRSWGRLLASLV